MSGSWLRATVSVFFCAWAAGASVSSAAARTRHSVVRLRLMGSSRGRSGRWGARRTHLRSRLAGRATRRTSVDCWAMATRARAVVALALGLLLLPAAAAPPARSADGALVREGVHENAAYRYEGPARWNGGLVMFAHGYQGALIECGIIDGIGLADFLYAYTAAAEYVGGVSLLDAPDRATFHRRVNEQWLPAVGTPDAFTERGRRFESVVKHLMGEAPLWREGLPRRYLMNLVYLAPGESRERLRRAVSTQHVRYRVDPGLGLDEAELNARVRRIVPEPGFRSRANDPAYAELTGRITVPVMAIHETGDPRVPFVLQQQYRRRTLAAGTADLLVQRAVRWPGHCAFDSEIRDQAFDDLVAWVEKGVKPAGDDVLTADRAPLGRRWTPRPHPADTAR